MDPGGRLLFALAGQLPSCAGENEESRSCRPTSFARLTRSGGLSSRTWHGGLNPGIRRPRATLVSSKAPNFANYSEPRLASPSGAYEPVVLEVVSHTTLACDRSLSHRCHHHGATPSGDLCRPRNGQNLEPATKNAPMIKAHVFDIGGF